MKIEIEAVSSPVFASDAGSAVDCLVRFSHLPAPVPFTARHDDVESHGRALHAELMGGDHGEIAPRGAPK